MITGHKGILAGMLILFIALAPMFAQNVMIDERFNFAASDTANYLNWSLGNKSTKDKFDAASGASLSGTTSAVNAVRFDRASTKKAAIPVGLWGLLLYPVSDWGTATADAFTVTTAGKQITVRFVHRGYAFELVTDAEGKFDPLTGAKYARGLADNVGGEYVLKKEFVKKGGDSAKMADLDWSKVALAPDSKSAQASRWYEGPLQFAVDKNVLTVKGTLVEKKAK